MLHIHYADRTLGANLLTKFYALTSEQQLYSLITYFVNGLNKLMMFIHIIKQLNVAD